MKEQLEKCKTLLTELVKYKIYGGDSNLAIIDFLSNHLNENDVEFKEVSNLSQDKKGLIVRIGPAVDGGVVLSGHTDVVPVEGQEWTSNPFEVIEKNGKYYGRGTCDMKGFLACCLTSIPIFQQMKLQRPIYFSFSYDEEIGCLSGKQMAEAIKSYYDETPRYAIIGEPTMMQPMIGHKGIVFCRTRVNGTAGHSSRIKEEVSAIHEAVRLMNWLHQRMDIFIENGDLDGRFDPPHTTIHIGQIHKSGVAPNVISDECIFDWDMRVIPKNNSIQVLEEFAQFCADIEKENKKRFPGFRILTEELHPNVPPLDTKESDEIVKIAKSLTGIQQVSTVAYAAEAGQFGQAGFETIICGPGDIAQAHRADEFVEMDQIEKCLDFLYKLGKFLSQ